MTSDFDRGTRDASPEPGSAGAGPSAGAAFQDDKNRLGSTVRHEADAAKDAASGAGAKIREGASTLAEDVRTRAQEQAESGKASVASGLGDFADAVRKASSELGEKDQSLAAGLMRQVASGLEQASSAIEGRSIEDLARSVTGFARRQPTAFLAGAALVGIAIGRVARATADHSGPASGRAWSGDNASGTGAFASEVGPSRWDDEAGRSRPHATPSGRSLGEAEVTSAGAAASSQVYGEPSRTVGGMTSPPSETPTKPASAVFGTGSGSVPPKEDSDVR